MATLTVTESTDYSATSLTNIDIVDFVNMDQAAEAKFASSQFSNWPLYRDILFDGSEAVNGILVTGGSVNAVSWDFTNWDDAKDSVILVGSAGGDVLYGSVRADRIEGLESNDSLSGNSGNDIILGGAGADYLNGGSGRDVVDGGSGDDIIYPSGNDMIDGGEGLDVLLVNTRRSNIDYNIDISSGGGGGNIGDGSTLTGIEMLDLKLWRGYDVIVGGDFNDRIFSRRDADTISGGGGDDYLAGGLSFDVVNGDGGDDRIVSEDIDQIDGGDGIDLLELDRHYPLFTKSITLDITAMPEDIGDGTRVANIERLVYDGSSLVDRIAGGDLDDDIDGRSGANVLQGRGGNDRLSGSGKLYGGAGNDILNGDGMLDGGNGDDALSGKGTLYGGEGNDKLGGTGLLFGGSGNDSFVCGSGTAEVTFHGGSGADFFEIPYYLRAGVSLSYSGSSGAIQASLELYGATFSGGDAEGDRTSGYFSNLTGSGFDDVITGNDLANTLLGEDGNDTIDGAQADDHLRGGAGDDYILGGRGKDVIDGGLGRDVMKGGVMNDTYVFTSVDDSGTVLSATSDLIKRFVAGTDFIDLSAIDADETGGTADDAFAFVAGAGTPFAAGVPGQLRFEFIAGNTIVSISTDADADAEAEIELWGEVNLSVGDFFL